MRLGRTKRPWWQTKRKWYHTYFQSFLGRPIRPALRSDTSTAHEVQRRLLVRPEPPLQFRRILWASHPRRPATFTFRERRTFGTASESFESGFGPARMIDPRKRARGWFRVSIGPSSSVQIKRPTGMTSGCVLALATPSLAEETARCENNGQMHRGIANREDAVKSQATIAPPDIKNLADLRQRLGGIPWSGSGFTPPPALRQRMMSFLPRHEKPSLRAA